MTDSTHQVAKEMAHLIDGIAYLVQALKNQPGFMKDNFNKEIQHYIDNLGDDKESVRLFLKIMLK